MSGLEAIRHRKCIAAWLFLLLLAIAVPVGGVSHGWADELRSDGGKRVNVSRARFLRLIELLLAEGKESEAITLVDRLPDDGRHKKDKLFLRAKIFEHQKKWREAEESYRALLSLDPSLHRVRLYLARLLFERGKDEAADYHFRLVLGADVPKEVRNKISFFLAQIRKRRWWRGSIEFAVVPDSNINTGPKSNEVTIFGLPFRLSGDATEKSGVGFQSVIDQELRPRLGRDLRFAFGGNITSRDYANDDFDDVGLTLRSGPVFELPRGEISVLGMAYDRWFGSRPYSSGHGGRVGLNYDVDPNISLELATSLTKSTNAINDGLDGRTYFFRAGGTITTSERSFIRLSGTWAWDDRRDNVYSSRRYGVGLGFAYEFSHAIQGYFMQELQYRPFEEENALFGKVRSDRLYHAEGKVAYARPIFSGLAPFLSISYEYNDSNIGFFSYRRVRGSIGFTRRF